MRVSLIVFNLGLILGCSYIRGVLCDADNEFAECVEHEICKEQDGKARALHCIKILSETDKTTVLEIFSKYYPNDTYAIEPLLDAGCGRLETAKEAVTYYYKEKFDRERMILSRPRAYLSFEQLETHPLDEAKRLQECRGCLMLMVGECQIKRQMGMIGFR